MASTTSGSDAAAAAVDFRERIPRDVIQRQQDLAAMDPAERERHEAEQERIRRLRRAEIMRPRYRRESGIEGDMWRCTFESFEIRDPAQHKARDMARLFCKRAPAVGRGLMLQGPTGTGKSHLLKAVLIGALAKEEPVRVRYVACAQLAHIARDRSFVNQVLDCDVLALDDIDKALVGNTDWAYEAVVAMLEAADSRGCPKLISTTEPPLRSVRDGKGEVLRAGLDTKVKPYVIGRLTKLFYWQEITGPDGRSDEYVEREVEWWAE